MAPERRVGQEYKIIQKARYSLNDQKNYGPWKKVDEDNCELGSTVAKKMYELLRDKQQNYVHFSRL